MYSVRVLNKTVQCVRSYYNDTQRKVSRQDLDTKKLRLHNKQNRVCDKKKKL
jgi:hypothetical protein